MRFAFSSGETGKQRLYLNVGHTGLNAPGFRTWLTATGVRPVYFVHDLIPITHPEFCRPGEQTKHRDRMITVLETADGVITNSDHTAGELNVFARNEGLPDPNTVTAHLGCDATRVPLRCETDHRPAEFAIVGTIEARKNHLLLLHVWARLVQRLGSKSPTLYVIGSRGWECEQVFDLLDRSETLKNSVVELKDCDDATLVRHLKSANALLFPSLVEGYGLPLVEALAAGTPAIASDLTVFREIAGDVPDYVDALDGPAWEQLILSYSDRSSSKRQQQLERLSRHRLPSWSDHFSIVERWLSGL